MKRIAALTTALVLAVPAVAAAGGWATINVSAPDEVTPGVPRPTTVTVMQHGRSPLDGVEPSVHISNGAGEQRSFPAVATGKPGQYRAEVVYPTAGRWEVVVDDGFTQRHNIAPVEVPAAIAGTAAGSSNAARNALIAGGGVVLLILAGSAVLLVSPERRAGVRARRRSRPASAS